MAAPPQPPGWVHLHSGAPSGPGWVRVPDDTPRAGEPPHGDPRPDWDPCHAAFKSKRVDPSAEPLRSDPTAPYGRRGPGGVRYTRWQYAKRFHIKGPGGIAWPPNQGAVIGTKLDYSDAYQYVHDFGDWMDRFGPPSGKYLALMENGISAFYEARAIHYESIYGKLQRYTLIPGNLPGGVEDSCHGHRARIGSARRLGGADLLRRKRQATECYDTDR